MAKTDSASVTLRGRFPAGTKVGLYPRYGDHFRGGNVLTSETVGDDGTVSFRGLPEGGKYFVAAEVDDRVRSAAVTAKVPAEAKQRLSRDEVREALRSTRPAADGRKIVTGPRNSVSARATGRLGRPFASETAGVPTADGEAEATPHLRQEDARDVPQRSATPTGMATPKRPGELVPAPRQSDVPADTPQRSATPLGVATPTEPEEAPAPTKKAPKRKSSTPKKKSGSGSAKRSPASRAKRTTTKDKE